MSLAVVTIPVVTPITDEPTAATVAQRLRDLAEVGPAIAHAVDALARGGWEMVKPEVLNDGAFVDVILAFAKDFDDQHAAESAARACVRENALPGRWFNADLGWNANREHAGGPAHYEAVDWWMEL
jgi:hypothetical protein